MQLWPSITRIAALLPPPELTHFRNDSFGLVSHVPRRCRGAAVPISECHSLKCQRLSCSLATLRIVNVTQHNEREMALGENSDVKSRPATATQLEHTHVAHMLTITNHRRFYRAIRGCKRHLLASLSRLPITIRTSRYFQCIPLNV